MLGVTISPTSLPATMLLSIAADRHGAGGEAAYRWLYHFLALSRWDSGHCVDQTAGDDEYEKVDVL